MRSRAELTNVVWLKVGRELQVQIFCWLAVTASVAATLFQYRDSSRHITLLFTIIAVMGGPHGALYTLAAKDKFQLTTLKRWLQFSAIYMCCRPCFAYATAAGNSVDSKLARILFIGLSALTVPHMLLIDRKV